MKIYFYCIILSFYVTINLDIKRNKKFFLILKKNKNNQSFQIKIKF